jgi:hypothetical protein
MHKGVLMGDGTVKLQELSDASGRSRNIIRNRQNRRDQPWLEDGREDGERRSYSGLHAVCLVIDELLVKQGFQAAQAAECIRAQEPNIRLSLDEIMQAREPAPRVVAAIAELVEDSWHGLRFDLQPYFGDGSVEALQAAIAIRLAGMGRIDQTRGGRSTERKVGGPQLAVVSILEAYRIAQERAQAAGFRIDGYEITRATGVEERFKK